LKDRDLRGAAKGALALGQIRYQRGKFAEAVETLKLFRSELKDEEILRCFGLGYLTLADARGGDLAAAESDFKLIADSACNDEPLAGYVALELSDAFEDAGDTKKAAQYMLVHVKHPSSQDDLEKLESAVIAANRLLRGGLIKDANQVINKIAKSPKVKGNPDLARHIVIFNGRRLMQEGKWTEAIEKLEGYGNRYKLTGDHPEDPYVLRDLGEAHVGGRDPKNPVEALQKADTAYNNAAGLMKTRAEFDKTLESVFLSWVLRLCEIKIMLGDAGVAGAHRQAAQLAESYANDESGPLKVKFQKIQEEAEAKLKKGKGKAQKAEPEKR
jgi:hypothetical protein